MRAVNADVTLPWADFFPNSLGSGPGAVNWTTGSRETVSRSRPGCGDGPRPVRRGSPVYRTFPCSHQGLRVQQLSGLLQIVGAEGDQRLPCPAVQDVEALDVHACGPEPLRHPGQCARLVG